MTPDMPVPFSMFVIGFIIFILYIIGFVAMITSASKKQQEILDNDPELQAYYKSLQQDSDFGSYANENIHKKFNPHAPENKYYLNKIKGGKKNVGKKMFWD